MPALRTMLGKGRAGTAMAVGVVFLSGPAAASLDSTEVTMPVDDITLTVICDNNSGDKDLKASWGFACLIERLRETILFDTGADGPALMANMAGLGISPGSVDVVVLSHAHRDHFGGLESVLKKGGEVSVYMLESFPQNVKGLARNFGAQLAEVSEPVAVIPGVTSTGEMRLGAGPSEQSLILTTGSGLIVLTGCAHPGIVAIVERAKEMTGQDVLLLAGGFHLFQKSQRATRATISRLEELGVRYVAPGHCSGDAARQISKTVFGDRYVNCAVGQVITSAALAGREGGCGAPGH